MKNFKILVLRRLLLVTLSVFWSTFALADIQAIPEKEADYWLSKISEKSLSHTIVQCQKSYSLTSLHFNMDAGEEDMAKIVEELRASYVASVANGVPVHSAEEYAFFSRGEGSLSVSEFLKLYYAAIYLDLKIDKLPLTVAICKSFDNMGIKEVSERPDINQDDFSAGQLGAIIIQGLRNSGLWLGQ